MCCDHCNLWVHLECTNLTLEQFKYLTDPDNSDEPFFCDKCVIQIPPPSTSSSSAPPLPQIPPADQEEKSEFDSTLNTSISDQSFSFHESDFELADDDNDEP